MIQRRTFLTSSAASLSALALANAQTELHSQSSQSNDAIEVLLPRNRVPLSFIIDDSTCLVNMGHYCTPQFGEVWPEQAEYQKDWRAWPREIPDSFVRDFGQWCAEQGVKGKYSIVPYPACVGWLDRELPGWSHRELQDSLKLVRDLMLPNWDIHPEMITHTRVIDIKTGRPRDPIGKSTMENWFPQEKISVDELASYLAYALRILKNCELPCEGITTPGGFGNQMRDQLPQAVDESVRDVFGTELPYYFKYVREGDEDTQPAIEYLRHTADGRPQATVNVPAGTGDWFGGWQGDSISEGDRYIDASGQQGRMAELIRKREPAIMLCHWPGMYSNGTREGFQSFQRIVKTIDANYREQTQWMKLSEIARYWAAKTWTTFRSTSMSIQIDAAISTKQFTFKGSLKSGSISYHHEANVTNLIEVSSIQNLDSGKFYREADHCYVCINLSKGESELKVEA
jgi:hypothetical protein